ncbi:MAG: hypothetical protein PVF19_12755, partial [Gemmatimonadota bacterium]
RRLKDRGTVVAAREALVGLLGETRAAAMRVGEARLHITSDPASASASVSDSTLRSVDLGGELGVAVELSGGRAEVDLEFDGLGLGRMAGQTIRLRRGEEISELVVSSYGRVRRR